MRLPMDETRDTGILREHLRWAQGYVMFWMILTFAIFGAAYAMAQMFELSNELRTIAFIVLGTVLIINAIWQAAGLALARLERIILPRVSR
jgi:hypothetical protein